MGDESTTAQVHPALFTRSLLGFAEAKGVKVVLATVDGLDFQEDGITPRAVLATDTNGEKLSFPATDVVFAAGPWTGQLAKKLLGPRAGAATNIVPSGCSTSILLRTADHKPISAHAVFSDLTLPSRTPADPEIFPRPDGTVYICGDHSDPGRQAPFPAKATDVQPSQIAVENLQKQVKFLSSHFEDATLEVRQACYRPESDLGHPIIGKLGEGIWIASGHSVWGISNGPGTGKCMAELIIDGKATSADIGGLSP